ncbi:MAG: DUF1861 family protein [Eubacteriales bacterium]
MFEKTVPALSVRDMYEDFKVSGRVDNARVEKFAGAEGYDVYNPSVPFMWEGREYIAGRVEKRDTELSEVRFFVRDGDVWRAAEGTVRLPLQDPFVTFVGGKLVLGGVNVTFPEVEGGDTCWQTDFYIGSPFGLEKFLEGPKQMKDVRLAELPDGKIAVCSRPQGASMEKYGCIAKIGFTVVNGLGELTADVIENAPFLEKMFKDDEWGGVNQLTVLKNGKLGAIGHKACRTYEADGQRLHYYGIAFAIDPVTREITQNKMIVSRDRFPETEKKRFDLGDITFTSGVLRGEDGTARVFTGLNDAYVGSAVIPDPFAEYEK